jgi:uncharacterized membrane protein
MYAAGYPGWLWTYGVSDWLQRTQDVDRMLRGEADTPRLLKLYGVDYVVLGPQEVAGRRESRAYWDAHANRVYENGDYVVYQVSHP